MMRVPALWLGAALLWLLPLVAMQFTGEMNWGAVDFLIFGVMLIAACTAYEIAARMTGSRIYRTIAAVAIMAVFALVWVELAVGIFD